MKTGNYVQKTIDSTKGMKLKYTTELSQEFSFEAAHSLPKVPKGHKCSRVHGHCFRVSLRVEGEINPESGWIEDFATISKAFQPIFLKLDHQYLNDIEGLQNPTSEMLAIWIIERIKLPKSVRLKSLGVKETCTSGCIVKIAGN